MQGLGILSAQGKYLTSFDSAGHLYWSTAMRAGIAFLYHADISYNHILEISGRIYIDKMSILFICTSAGVVHFHNCSINNHLGTFLNTDRAHESSYTACSCNCFILSHMKLNSVLKEIYYLYIIYIMIASYKGQNQLALLRLEGNSLNSLFKRKLQILSHLFNGMGIRSRHLLKLLHLLWLCLYYLKLSLFIRSSIITGAAVCNIGLTSLSQYGKLVGMASTYSTIICLYWAELQAHTGEYVSVGIIHLLI